MKEITSLQHIIFFKNFLRGEHAPRPRGSSALQASLLPPSGASPFLTEKNLASTHQHKNSTQSMQTSYYLPIPVSASFESDDVPNFSRLSANDSWFVE